MKKEEKIKEAWGELWNSFNDSAKKCALDNDGHVASILQNGLNKDFTEFDTALVSWRPKSLKGIENNNGWIKIESEDDLPKKGSNCYFILKNGVSGIFVDLDDSEYLTLRNRGTHYQPIVKPKPPIY